MKTAVISSGLLACGLMACGIEQDDTRAVNEANELGVVSLQTESFVDHGNNVFVLHAFSADEQEEGSVRLTQGTITGLAGQGSEIVVTVGANSTRMVTREMELYKLDASDPAVDKLLGIDAVASALKQEAHIVVVAPLATPGPLGERAFNANFCSPNDLLTTPTAAQCCASVINDRAPSMYAEDQVRFVNPNNQVVLRYRNPSGVGCRASNGSSSCSGASCYFGPNGFARATLYGGSGYAMTTYNWVPVEFGNSYESVCDHYFAGSPATPFWTNVTGNFPTSQGCPGGVSGAGDWDY